MKNPEQLIADYLDDALSESDQKELNAWLKADAANMQRFTEAVMFEQQIRAAAQAKAQQLAASGFEATVTPAKSQARWLSWRPLTAAAAGLVFGLLSASLVYGFVSPSQVKVKAMIMEGFEDKDMRTDHLVPNRVGVWGGNLLPPQGAEAGVKPAEGLYMVKLPWVERKKMTYAFRFLDMTQLPPLAAVETRQIEVTARFQSASPIKKDRFQIRLAAFAEDVGAAREIWVNDFVDEMALMHLAKTVRTDADASGWTSVSSVIDVPASARVVLIALAAGVADTEIPKTGYYLDDVHVRLITHEAPLP